MPETLTQPKICDGCGVLGPSIRVYVTNGALTLCEQCLGDVNRKNPELVTLKAEANRLAAENQRLKDDLTVANRDFELAADLEEKNVRLRYLIGKLLPMAETGCDASAGKYGGISKHCRDVLEEARSILEAK